MERHFSGYGHEICPLRNKGMKLWHRIRAWFLTRRIHRERKRLSHYVQSSAQEICAWQQEIIDLEMEAAQQREMAGVRRPVAPDSSDKVILLEQNAA